MKRPKCTITLWESMLHCFNKHLWCKNVLLITSDIENSHLGTHRYRFLSSNKSTGHAISRKRLFKDDETKIRGSCLFKRINFYRWQGQLADSCEFLLFFIHLLIICKLISPAVLSGMTNVVKEQKSKVRIGKRTTISDVSGVKYRKEMETVCFPQCNLWSQGICCFIN